MVQIKILSGKKAGSFWDARHFPVRIGRSPDSDLRIEEAGVWDDHIRLILDASAGFLVETHANALASVNGQSIQNAPLRNGDRIDIGSVKLQFWLGEARQRGQRFREMLVWAVIVGVCLGQVAFVYWLLRLE